MRPGDMLQLDGIDILAVPAHNVDKRFHRPEHGWLGYVFTVGGVTYYHAGDTDFLPAMFGIRCDVAFLPCGGHYTMGPEDAARAAEACGAKVVVPIHWGDPHGTREDVARIGKISRERCASSSAKRSGDGLPGEARSCRGPASRRATSSQSRRKSHA